MKIVLALTLTLALASVPALARPAADSLQPAVPEANLAAARREVVILSISAGYNFSKCIGPAN